MSELTDWLTSVGTIGAAGTAVWAALRPGRLAYRRRPLLDVETGEEVPLERSYVVDSNVRHWLLRLRIKNHGQTTARAVRVSVDNWWSWAQAPPFEGKRWWLNDIDPVSLHSINEIDSLGRQLATKVDIPPKSSALFEFLMWNLSKRILSLMPPENFLTPFSIGHGPYFEQRFAVSVTSDNAEGLMRVVSLTVREGEPIDPSTGRRRPPIQDVHFAEIPPQDEVIPSGSSSPSSESQRTL